MSLGAAWLDFSCGFLFPGSLPLPSPLCPEGQWVLISFSLPGQHHSAPPPSIYNVPSPVLGKPGTTRQNPQNCGSYKLRKNRRCSLPLPLSLSPPPWMLFMGEFPPPCLLIYAILFSNCIAPSPPDPRTGRVKYPSLGIVPLSYCLSPTDGVSCVCVCLCARM